MQSPWCGEEEQLCQQFVGHRAAFWLIGCSQEMILALALLVLLPKAEAPGALDSCSWQPSLWCW